MILAVIVVLRVVMLALAIWLLKRTGSSLLALSRDSQPLAEAGRAAQAFFALSAMTGQVFYLMWTEPPVLLLALIFFSIGLGLAIWTSKRGEAKGLRRLDAMINRPDLSLPLVELAEYSEDDARTIAQQVRAMVIDRKRSL